jgi:hypothetical protein
VDELDAGISGAGQIIGDDSYQHFSTLRLRQAACRQAEPEGRSVLTC